MYIDLIGLFLLSLLSFIIVYISTPNIAKKLKEKGLISKDLHKLNDIKIPNAGGLSILLGFSVAFTFAGILNVDTKSMLLVYLVGILAGLLGLLDDILTLRKRSLVILSLLIGTPFIFYHAGSTFITLTPFGPSDLGAFYWPLVLLGVAFLSNGVNIYAGFNGLEAGLGLITSLSLGVCAVLYGSIESSIVLFILAGALLAFVKFNFYPAKIFMGNSGTYMIGAVIASAIIVGTIKTVGLIACIPYILNFILRLSDKLKWTVGNVDSEGNVFSDKINSLWSIFMYKNPTNEKSVVLKCWFFQALFGVLAILYAIISV